MHILFFPIVFFQSANSYLRDVTNYPGTIDVTNYTEWIVQALADRLQYSAGYWLH